MVVVTSWWPRSSCTVRMSCPSQQVGGEGVAERLAGHAFGDARAKGGHPHRALQDGLVEMMSAALPGHAIEVDACGRKDPLPGPLAPGVRVLPAESPRQLDPAGALPEI